MNDKEYQSVVVFFYNSFTFGSRIYSEFLPEFYNVLEIAFEMIDHWLFKWRNALLYIMYWTYFGLRAFAFSNWIRFQIQNDTWFQPFCSTTFWPKLVNFGITRKIENYCYSFFWCIVKRIFNSLIQQICIYIFHKIWLSAYKLDSALICSACRIHDPARARPILISFCKTIIIIFHLIESVCNMKSGLWSAL